jgi:Helix-turn-helix
LIRLSGFIRLNPDESLQLPSALSQSIGTRVSGQDCKTDFCFSQVFSPGPEDRMGVRARRRQKRLAGKLKLIRESLGLTQKEILKALKIDWLHQSNISSYELGATEPPLHVIEKYAAAANVCMDVLISDKYELPDTLPAQTLYHPH